MGELISELVDAGLRPRVMLEYSGTLLHELRRTGADDVLDALRAITVDGRYRGAVAGLYVGTGRGARRRLPCRTTRRTCARGSSTSRLCSDWRHWGGCAGSALGNGAAQPSRRGVRVRAYARGCRLPLGARARTHGRAVRRAGPAPSPPPARPVVLELERRVGQDPPRRSRRRAATPNDEFPPKYREVVGEIPGFETPMLTGTEYLQRGLCERRQ
jgi:hypothetical protein